MSDGGAGTDIDSGILFDGGGNFLKGLGNGTLNPTGTTVRWDSQADADAILRAFGQHYGDDRISIREFEIEDFDDASAAALIDYLMRDAAGRKACEARAPGWLPEISFFPEEANIKVTQSSAYGAHRQRILSCRRPTSLPVTYTSDEERRRVEKYEAAAELQESPPTSEIYKDCSADNGCRSRTAIAVNGHSYYASYGRTQFVAETFLRTLAKLITDLSVEESAGLGLTQSVVLPDGSSGTMVNMVVLARDHATSAVINYRDYRNRFGRGLAVAQAKKAWNSLSESDQKTFKSDTGLGETEFIDVASRTEAEGQNAFGTEAAMRILDGQGNPSFGTWLMNLYSSQDAYNFVSRRFLQDNLNDLLKSPRLSGQFANDEAPGTEGHAARQREVELNLAQRMAALHNWGNLRRVTGEEPSRWPRYVRDYVVEFIGVAGRGDWVSLRCTDDFEVMKQHKGLQMQELKLS